MLGIKIRAFNLGKHTAAIATQAVLFCTDLCNLKLIRTKTKQIMKDLYLKNNKNIIIKCKALKFFLFYVTSLKENNKNQSLKKEY